MSGPDGTPKAGSEETHGSQAPQGPVPAAGSGDASEADGNLPARLGEERLAEPVIRTGLFGVQVAPAKQRTPTAMKWPLLAPQTRRSRKGKSPAPIFSLRRSVRKRKKRKRVLPPPRCGKESAKPAKPRKKR